MVADTDVAQLIPEHIQCIFGPPPLIRGESSQDYHRLLAEIAASVAPTNIIEWIYVKDIVDLTWEIIRYRRAKSEVIELELPFAAAPFMQRVTTGESPASLVATQNDYEEGQRLIIDAMIERPFEKTEAASVLKEHGLALTSLSSAALVSKLAMIEAIDRLITRAEKRRDTVLQEIERRQSVFGSALRNAAKSTVVELAANSG